MANKTTRYAKQSFYVAALRRVVMIGEPVELTPRQERELAHLLKPLEKPKPSSTPPLKKEGKKEEPTPPPSPKEDLKTDAAAPSDELHGPPEDLDIVSRVEELEAELARAREEGSLEKWILALSFEDDARLLSALDVVWFSRGAGELARSLCLAICEGGTKNAILEALRLVDPGSKAKSRHKKDDLCAMLRGAVEGW